MSTPDEHPDPDDALVHAARAKMAHATRAKMAAALNDDHKPEPDEPMGCQPVWKRPWKPKSKAAKVLNVTSFTLEERITVEAPLITNHGV
ncbi:hypothetical protein [Streptomyces sp. NBC_01013]|uniref:hypothetical protein n=1 Tax=Streptomyces sp. NBC_01013 TaxID=2903718 RepID=UPI00386AC96B|nr:hypothetical protein OG538_36020 [Streptomyces sp. NBC_01013]